MIYTLTLNPSIDYVMELDELTIGGLNRTNKVEVLPGGKGINVTQVLNRLGVPSTALGFIGGFTGAYIKSYLKQQNIPTDFVEINENTRINVKIKSTTETEINANGPSILPEHYEDLKNQIHHLTANDTLVLSGSIPSSLPHSTYKELVEICSHNSIRFVVDAEGDYLKNILSFKPFLIKPNHHELGQLFHTKITTIEEVMPYAQELVNMGAQNVIVSLAGDGAVFANHHSIYVATVPKGEVKSSVGAGDSMVAGFLATYEQTNSVEEAFRFSVASGSATAFSIGLCTRENVEHLLPQVILDKKSGKGD
ncbi:MULTISPECIES: 1-phosphofructokinase [Lysinibacillus]|uniref:Tagatose-6-phosphate kinase n=1 Tax=Lysinibacillus antri TaxID=2498145 RepID=A0A432LBV4_9BACI|nr:MULTISPECIES: 1-phosphofructokinase [Lysinibacillus]RUL52240.1 1-phosphofructokinase [Lysinibacillus antri]TSI05185.1 1-phosphofructokinase [Lysinibacillus sp. BW-2-10]